MKGHKIFKKLTHIKARKFFLFVYDQGTKELFTEPTKHFYEFKELYEKYKGILSDEYLLNIYKDVYAYTKRRYEEFSNIFNVKPDKEYEALNYLIKELINRNHLRILVKNTSILDQHILYEVAIKIIDNNDVTLMLSMLAADNVPESTRKLLEYHLFSTRDYSSIYKYALNSEKIYDLCYLMEILYQGDIDNNQDITLLAEKYYNHPGFDWKKFAKYLIRNNETEYLEFFFSNVLNIEDEFFDCLIELSNAWELCQYARENQEYLSCEQIQKIEAKLVTCNEPKALFKFLSDVAEANLFNIQNAFIEQGCCKYMYLLAKNFEAADTKLLRRKINKSEDLLYMYKFDNDINKMVRYDVIKRILNSDDPKLICAFSNICPKEHLKDCEEKLKKFEDDKYLRFFYESHRR